jgi:hypothetical protein
MIDLPVSRTGQKYWAGWRSDSYFGSYPRGTEFKSSERH